MAGWTLLVTATVLAGVGAAFALVGRRALHRAARPADAAAYVLFWYAASAFLTITAFMDALAALGVTDSALFGALNHVSGLGLVAACAGLAAHAAFVVTVSRRALVPVAAYYLGAYTMLLALGVVGGAPAVEPGAWSVEVTMPGAPEWAMTATLAALLTPPAVGAVALLVVAGRVREAVHRRRIALVATTLLAWMAAAVLVTPQATFWTGPLLYVAGAATLLVAFRGAPAPAPAPVD